MCSKMMSEYMILKTISKILDKLNRFLILFYLKTGVALMTE